MRDQGGIALLQQALNPGNQGRFLRAIQGFNDCRRHLRWRQAVVFHDKSSGIHQNSPVSELVSF